MKHISIVSILSWTVPFSLCSHLLTVEATKQNAIILTSTTVVNSSSTQSSLDPVNVSNNNKSSNGNPITQLTGFVWDSMVRMKNGTVQLYTNHQRCNDIRSKQKAYLTNLSESIPDADVDQRRKMRKYRPTAGGISYEEFDFLQKGKEDRGKLANIVFMMMFAPNFVPYAFMFFPEMLPSPFAATTTGISKVGIPINKWDSISRERTHAVVKTLLAIEREARVAPMMSNINPFGKGKTKALMEKTDTLGRAGGALLAAEGGSGSEGAQLVMNVLRDEIFTEKPSKEKAQLMVVPKSIIKGISQAIEAPATSLFFLPTFIVRSKVLTHLKQLSDADEFLVTHNIDLNTINSDLLTDACSARLIGGPGRSVDEMRNGLSSWLDMSVKQPNSITEKSGLHYNSNLARLALLCYHALDGARDARAASYLPRLLYQGQISGAMTTPPPTLSIKFQMQPNNSDEDSATISSFSSSEETGADKKEESMMGNSEEEDGKKKRFINFNLKLF